jgi:hypothetical protein
MERESRAAVSRVALAIAGAFLAVSVGAAFAVASPLHLGIGGFFGPGGDLALPTATSSDTAQEQPTETPTLPEGTATRAPRPTATARSCGVTSDLHGVIASVPPNTAQNSFALWVCGATKTILVNANTKYQGAATSLASLKPGWLAEVACVLQSGSTYLASDVNAQVGGN